MKNNITGLLLVACMVPFVLIGQENCKHCADFRMYFQTYEEAQIDGQLNIRLYCIAEEKGTFHLPAFSALAGVFHQRGQTKIYDFANFLQIAHLILAEKQAYIS